MIVSLLYRAARTMVSIPAVLLRRDTAKDAELLVLRHDNTVLRRQLKGLVRYESADRFWLSVLSSLITRHAHGVPALRAASTLSSKPRT
jgi:putative transposase